MLLFLLFFVLPLPLLIWLFIRSKTRKAKWIIGTIVTLFTAFLVFMAIGLWRLDVEDLYGTKQEIFWEGSSGDTVKLVDDETKMEIARGILKKTWHRIHIKTNNQEKDILGWIDDEIGAYYIESENEIKDGVVTLNMLTGNNWAYFKGPKTSPNALDIKYIVEDLILYKFTSLSEHQIPNKEKGLARFKQAKKDTLIYQNSVDGNNLIISFWEEKGNRKAKIYRASNGKNVKLEALDYDQFSEKR